MSARRRIVERAWNEWEAEEHRPLTDEEAKHLVRALNLGGLLLVVTLLLPLAAALLIQRTEVELLVGVVLVVTIGAVGLVLRGMKELRHSPGLKACGYFFGAAAYAATALVALSTGLSAVLERIQ